MKKGFYVLHLFFFFIFLFFTACSQKTPVTWEERIVKAKQKMLPLTYVEYGNPKNKTLLFLHGFAESKETWRFLVPELSKKYHLVLLDLKGFGASPKPEDSHYSVYDQAVLVANFMKEKSLKDVTIVGRSFGGGVALVLALMQKEKLIQKDISRLVLINSMAYKQFLPSMLRILNQPIIGYLAIHTISDDWMAEEGYRYAFYNNNLIPKESLEQASLYLSLPNAKYAYLESVEQLIPDDIEKIQKRYREILLPTLILWGKEDVSISVSKAYKLHRDLKRSKLRIFPKVGHMPNEEAPYRVVREILKFMEEQ
ncbi:MAG: Hydrolase, alpha/beta fold family [uncultured Sulfurovum sp.]|uniref:Hydrolase, alpha/beta fold family n=1 Tax=uncultured Sulfurovum sp. TaxID=269237 RepID=A0A6S6T290_9BACT|nr:MAG: Hydrolase, alpha/beta fold family [uncultured Sulfurovum sp.]